jgi:hypothetical protein
MTFDKYYTYTVKILAIFYYHEEGFGSTAIAEEHFSHIKEHFPFLSLNTIKKICEIPGFVLTILS